MKKKNVGAAVAATVIFAVLTALGAGAAYVLVPTDETLFWLWGVPVLTGVITLICLIISLARGAANKKIKNESVVIEEESAKTVVEEAAEEKVAEEVKVEEVKVEEVLASEPEITDTVEEVATETAEAATAIEEPAIEESCEEIPAQEPATEQIKEEAPKVAVMPTIVSDASAVAIRYRSSFMSRLIQSDAPMQDYYTTIKNYILSFKGVKAKSSWNYESFNIGRTQCIKLNVKGKALVLNFALDPTEYNVNKYHFIDVSDDSKFKDVPMQMKVKSDRSVKYTLELVDELMKKLDVEQGDVPTVDYHMPFEANSSLAERGLVKVILPVGVKLEDLEAVKEENVGSHIDAFREV